MSNACNQEPARVARGKQQRRLLDCPSDIDSRLGPHHPSGSTPSLCDPSPAWVVLSDEAADRPLFLLQTSSKTRSWYGDCQLGASEGGLASLTLMKEELVPDATHQGTPTGHYSSSRISPPAIMAVVIGSFPYNMSAFRNHRASTSSRLNLNLNPRVWFSRPSRMHREERTVHDTWPVHRGILVERACRNLLILLT